MTPSVGLLPLYLKLYDDTMPELSAQFAPFLEGVESSLRAASIRVERAAPCRVRDEVASAVRAFENAGVDLLLTLHLAYSPSLESADVLRDTPLPLLLVDTTMDATFTPRTDPMRLMFNHGIHGVQDLASVLRRMGRPYEVVAGHVGDTALFEAIAQHARAAAAARRLSNTRALRIGPTFVGMGDFAAPDRVLEERLGIRVRQIELQPLIEATRGVSEQDVNDEMRLDRERYRVTAPDEVHRRSVRVGLGLRRYLDQHGITAFSANFLVFNRVEGPVDTVPFLEASKAMARGIGYAGEGDVLTAALVGALQSCIGPTTFTEMFCPDWRHGTVFISHMGEVNPKTAAATPVLCEKDFPWTGTRNPAILACAAAPGPAVIVNLAPAPHDTFRLIIAPVDVEQEPEDTAFSAWVRGWLRPRAALERFLESYSRAGGTHHIALTLGVSVEALEQFARYAGIECVRVDTT